MIMNELKLFEAMNLIDDDLIREADMHITDISSEEAVTAAAENDNSDIIVSGVESYRAGGWHRLAAAASLILLLTGAAAGGALLIRGRRPPVISNDDFEAETVSTAFVTDETASGEITITGTSVSSNKTTATTSSGKAEKSSKKTGSAKQDKNISAAETESSVLTGTFPADTPSAKQGNTAQSRSSKTTAAKTSASSKTTTVKTTTTPPVAKNSKRMALYDVYQLSKDSALTWSDFDPYIGEDVGSGIYSYMYNILDGYTLYVMGVPPKAPDKIWLYKGTDAPMDGEHIDIRYEDINEFINSEQVLKDKEMLYKEIHPDSVSRIQVTSSSGKSTELSYPEVKSLVSLLKDRDLLRKDSGYEVLSLNRYDINISYYGVGPLQQRETNISIIGDYLIINGESYICEGSSDNINRFLYSVTNRDEPRYVEVGNGEVWCWNNFMGSNVSMHDYYEKIIISAFPDIVFTWNGMNESGIMLERNGEKIITLGGMPLWSAFFTDLNGDGYPEICSSLSIGSGIIDTRVGVYDIKNDRHYELEGRMDEIDYFLFMENGELFVNKQSANIGWAPLSANGEKGKLAIENGELIFHSID